MMVADTTDPGDSAPGHIEATLCDVIRKRDVALIPATLRRATLKQGTGNKTRPILPADPGESRRATLKPLVMRA